ncbi:MAG: hypothetical protein WAO83_03925, partial [Fuerstiella sp.]
TKAGQSDHISSLWVPFLPEIRSFISFFERPSSEVHHGKEKGNSAGQEESCRKEKGNHCKAEH